MSGLLSLFAGIIFTILLYAIAIVQGKRLYKKWKRKNPVQFGKPVPNQVLDVANSTPKQQFQLAAGVTWAVVAVFLLMPIAQAMSVKAALMMIVLVIGGGYGVQYYLRRQALIITPNVINTNPRGHWALWVFGDSPIYARRWIVYARIWLKNRQDKRKNPL